VVTEEAMERRLAGQLRLRLSEREEASPISARAETECVALLAQLLREIVEAERREEVGGDE
jgi:hypothetical protein